MQENKPLIIMISGFLLLGLLFGSLMYTNNLSSISTPQSKTPGNEGITVQGESEIVAKGTTAYLTLGVQQQGANAQIVQENLTKKVNQVFAAIAAMGVKKDDLETQRVSLNPVYDYIKGRPKLIGFEGSNIIRIKITDLTKVGPVLDKAVAAGANNVENISFGLLEESQAKSEALAQAGKNAREKAEALAKTMGVKIVGLKSIQDNATNLESPNQPWIAEDYRIRNVMKAKSETPIVPQEIKVKAQVTAVFEIQ